MDEKTIKHLTTVLANMRMRCNNKKNPRYPDYGGREIKICKRWSDKNNFIKDMGPSYKKGLQIERIVNSKGYSPDNCKWVTPLDQARNKRNNHNLTFNGKTKPMAEWADVLKIPYSTLICRINGRRWPTKKALTTPVSRPNPPREIKRRGETRSAAEWSRITGIPASTILYRLNKNLPINEVFKKRYRRPQQIKDGPVFFSGRTLKISEWAKELNIPYTTLLSRFKVGWPVEKVLNRNPFNK